jgi:hypothetical protein
LPCSPASGNKVSSSILCLSQLYELHPFASSNEVL